jgi:hypothetical protein
MLSARVMTAALLLAGALTVNVAVSSLRQERRPTAVAPPARSGEANEASVASVTSEGAAGAPHVEATDDTRDEAMRGLTEADVERLLRIDPASDPRETSEAISRLGAVAAGSDRRSRDRIAGVLARWLGDETRRDDPAARGHVSHLVDALADTGSTEAVAPLTALLAQPGIPLHVKTRAVDSLSALAAGGAKEIAAFGASLGAPSPEDGELEREARTSVARALARLAPP